MFSPGDELLDVVAPESYIEQQLHAVARAPEAPSEPPAVPCHIHPENPALGFCAGCTRPLCDWCNMRDGQGKHGYLCETCFFNDVLSDKHAKPMSPSEILRRESEQPIPDRHPSAWEMRSSVGRTMALQRTWLEIMLQPVEFFRTLQLAGDSWSPLVFAFAWAVLGLLTRRMWIIIGLMLGFREQVGLGVSAHETRMYWEQLGGEFQLLLFIPVLALALVVAEVAAVQTLLLLVGERHARLRITWRLAGYAAAPWVLLLLPGLGALLAVAVHIGVLVAAMRHGYHLRAGRAWLVSCTPWVLFGAFWYRATLEAWATSGYAFVFPG